MTGNNDAENAFALAVEANTKIIALSVICASLMGEIALLHPNPHERLAQMSLGLQGMIHGLSLETETDPGTKPMGEVMTKITDLVCSIAERAMPKRRPRPSP